MVRRSSTCLQPRRTKVPTVSAECRVPYIYLTGCSPGHRWSRRNGRLHLQPLPAATCEPRPTWTRTTRDHHQHCSWWKTPPSPGHADAVAPSRSRSVPAWRLPLDVWLPRSTRLHAETGKPPEGGSRPGIPSSCCCCCGHRHPFGSKVISSTKEGILYVGLALVKKSVERD